MGHRKMVYNTDFSDLHDMVLYAYGREKKIKSKKDVERLMLAMICPNCKNRLVPDNANSGRNYKPFSLKIINLVDKKSGDFYEKGEEAQKIVIAKWFNKLSETQYNEILDNVELAFSDMMRIDEQRKEVEAQVQGMIDAKLIPPEQFEIFVNNLLKTKQSNGGVEQYAAACDELFTQMKRRDEMSYQQWISSYAYKLMQYNTIKFARQVFTLEDAIDKQLELEFIESANDILKMNEKLGIVNMQVACNIEIISCTYGYTRKTADPMKAKELNSKCRLKLNAYDKTREGNANLVYGAKLETEGILFEISQKKIIEWLFANSIISEEQLPDMEDELSIKKWYAENVKGDEISMFGEIDANPETIVTKYVFALLHSMSHAFIKTAGEISGLSGNSLTEIVIAETASVFVYAQTTQAVPLGALSGMAENNYYQFLNKVFEETRNCVFDPICSDRDDTSCSACMIIPEISCNAQLGEIVENPDACWVFASLGRDEVLRNRKELFSYLDSLVRTNINEDIILSGRSRDYYSRDGVRQSLENIKGIDAEFIENQSIDWLHDFYKWISETKHRRDVAVDKPIFIDQDGNATPAFDKAGQLILFLPVENMTGYSVVHPELLQNEETRAFIEQIGIKQPSLKDQIYNIILPQYKDGAEIDTDPHFMLFFKYYCKCSNEEIDEYIDLIKECEFLTYYDSSDGKAYRAAANTMYLPSEELLAYFETKPDVRFIAIDEYKSLVGSSQESRLIKFLTDLGIKTSIQIVTKTIYKYDTNREDLPRVYSTRGSTYEETVIEGCKEIVDYILESEDIEKSYILWESLISIIRDNSSEWHQVSLSSLIKGVCRWFYYSPQRTWFESSDTIMLRNEPWILNSDGEFVSASEITKDMLSDQYDTDSEYAQSLIRFLNISDEEEEEIEEEEDDSNLTDEQREFIEFARKMKEAGIKDDADIEEFLRLEVIISINITSHN